MGNQEYQDDKIRDTDPAKLDKLADEKYIDAMRDQTESLSKADTASIANDNEDVFGDADDGVSVSDEEGVIADGADNVSAEEIADLENAATRMPDEQDDMADMTTLDDSDLDGTPLNEKEDMMGGDLDIGQSEEDSNIYDDNED
jgi:hypothetical protein